MKHLAAFALFTIGSMSFGQTCTTTPVGGAESQYAYGFVCDRSADGGTVVAVQPDNALGAMPIGRVAADGSVAWSQRVSCTNPYFKLVPHAVVATDDGGAVIMGEFIDNLWMPYCFFIRVDGNGQPVVAKIMGRDSVDGSGYDWSHMCATQDGGFVIAGGNEGSGPVGSIALVKLDANGGQVWAKRFETDADGAPYQRTEVNGLLEDPNGDLVLFSDVGAQGEASSQWLIRTDAFGDALMVKRYDAPWRGYSACGTSDGGYVVGGSTVGNGNIPCLWKLDHDGVAQWSNVLPAGSSPYDVHITSIAELTDGSLIATPKWGDNISLYHFSGSGQLLDAMYAPAGYDIPKIAGTGQDSLSFVYSASSNNSIPTVMHATALADASCALNAASSTDDPSVPSWTSSTAPLPSSDRIMKRWDLSIGPLTDLTGLDVRSHVSSGCPRPGFPFYTCAMVRNFGGDPSGALDVSMTVDPSLVLTSFYPEGPSSTAGNVVTWNLPALAPFGTYEFYIGATVPVSTPLGTVLTTSVTASQPLTEVDLANNTAVFNDIVTGSYDPNDKLVLPRDFYHIENDSVLDYTIRFQNTGTDTAFTVVVVDTLPLDVDTRTFEMGAASHPYTYTLSGNGILTFTFENILLPDSNTNEPLSHGLVNFRIKPILPLQLGQEITNRADIYFDFNPPIRTPDATVVVTDETGVLPVVKPDKLTVYPVPVKQLLTAVLPSGFVPTQAFAIGADGRRVPLFRPNLLERMAEFDVHHLTAGSYVLSLSSKDGRRLSARFTKE